MPISRYPILSLAQCIVRPLRMHHIFFLHRFSDSCYSDRDDKYRLFFSSHFTLSILPRPTELHPNTVNPVSNNSGKEKKREEKKIYHIVIPGTWQPILDLVCTPKFLTDSCSFSQFSDPTRTQLLCR